MSATAGHVAAQAARYLAVVVGALAVDVAAATAALRLGAPPPVAVAAGLAAAFLASLPVHGAWTFRGVGSPWRKALPFALVNAAVWVVRSLAVTGIDAAVPAGMPDWARFCAAACVSFPVGFALSRRLFHGRPAVDAKVQGRDPS